MIILPILSILGLSNLTRILLSTDAATAPFFTVAAIGIFQFLLACFGILSTGTNLLLLLGLVLFGITNFNLLRQFKQLEARQSIIIQGIYIGAALIIIAYSSHLQFRSIDDYSYWGLISKYLFFFNELPKDGHIVSASFLTYTPGVASLHYFFYKASGYSQSIGYTAQGILLLSALIALFDYRRPSLSLIQISLSLLILCLSSGAILARMEVDGYLASFIFLIIWLIYTQKKAYKALVTTPIIYLYLIKEIGLFFAVMCILMMVVLENRQTALSFNKKEAYFRNYWYFLLLISGVFLARYVWTYHWTQAGFKPFASTITMQTALASLQPFSEKFHHAQYLFLRGLLFEKFDRVFKFPYWFISLFLFFTGYQLNKKLSPDQYQRAKIITLILILFILIYLILIYFLQAITFKVGVDSNELLSFPRYFNIGFTPLVLFCAQLFLENYYEKRTVRLHAFLPLSIIVLTCGIIIGGRIQRQSHFYNITDANRLASSLKKQLITPSQVICVKPITQPSYKLIMPLQYFLLPNRIIDLTQPKPPISCDFNVSLNEESI